MVYEVVFYRAAIRRKKNIDLGFFADLHFVLLYAYNLSISLICQIYNAPNGMAAGVVIRRSEQAKQVEEENKRACTTPRRKVCIPSLPQFTPKLTIGRSKPK